MTAEPPLFIVITLLFSEHEWEEEAALNVVFCLLKEKQLWLDSEISV